MNLARTALHSILCIERQGVNSLLKFVEPKLAKGRSKIDASFVKDRRVQRAYRAAKLWKGTSHPKVEPLLRTIAQQTGRKPGSKVIVFAELRDTVEHLESLIGSNGVRVGRFTGQGSRGCRKSMTQRQQRETLRRFASGEFQVLCATSIAEEGLDVPQVDLVVFYEPVASDVRLIQRKGRTGRDSPGRVVILTTDRTADEGYLHASIRREKRMKRMVKRLAQNGIEGGAASAGRESGVRTRPVARGRSVADQRTIDDYDGSAA